MTLWRQGLCLAPEELETLDAAFRLAWRELDVSRAGLNTNITTQLAKKRLAECVFAAVSRVGAHNSETLKQEALRLWHTPVPAPLRPCAAFFGPDELDALSKAYRDVWRHMRRLGLKQTCAAEVKQKLAQVILASACAGNPDADRLKDIALRALSPERVRRAVTPGKVS